MNCFTLSTSLGTIFECLPVDDMHVPVLQSYCPFVDQGVEMLVDALSTGS